RWRQAVILQACGAWPAVLCTAESTVEGAVLPCVIVAAGFSGLPAMRTMPVRPGQAPVPTRDGRSPHGIVAISRRIADSARRGGTRRQGPVERRSPVSGLRLRGLAGRADCLQALAPLTEQLGVLSSVPAWCVHHVRAPARSGGSSLVLHDGHAGSRDRFFFP